MVCATFTFLYLGCEYLQCVSFFSCVVSICSVFLSLCCEYLQHIFCQTDEDVFLICGCFLFACVFCCSELSSLGNPSFST